MAPHPFVETLELDGDGHRVVAHRAGASVGTAPTVVASHGITASALSWSRIAHELGEDATFVALDHRGRGDSSEHPGPYGMAAHARDCVAVLDRLGVERGVMVGHSMGAFVVARAAGEHPERVSAAVFVDGGLPIETPEGVDPDETIEAVVGPAVTRLNMTWPDHDAVYTMWQQHPAFGTWSHWHRRYIDHDVEEDGAGSLRCRVSESAVRFDGAEAIVDTSASRRILDVSAPAWLLRAARGLLDDPAAPLLSEEAVRDLRRARPDVTVVDLPDELNHYSVMFSDVGTAEVVQALRVAMAIDPDGSAQISDRDSG